MKVRRGQSNSHRGRKRTATVPIQRVKETKERKAKRRAIIESSSDDEELVAPAPVRNVVVVQHAKKEPPQRKRKEKPPPRHVDKYADVDRMVARGKDIKRLAHFQPCQEDDCKCDNFTSAPPKAIVAERVLLQFGMTDNVQELELGTACLTCEHSLESHNVEELRKLSIREIDELSLIVTDMMDGHFMHEMNKGDTYRKLVVTDVLHRAFMALRMGRPSLYPIADYELPPFESPSARCIVQHFVHSTLSSNEKEAKEDILIASRFLSLFNTWNLPDVREYIDHTEDMEGYIDFHRRWTYFIDMPLTCHSLPFRDAVDIFGIRGLLRYMRWVMVKHAYSIEMIRQDEETMARFPWATVKLRRFARRFFAFLVDLSRKSNETLKRVKHSRFKTGYEWPPLDTMKDLAMGGEGRNAKIFMDRALKVQEKHDSDLAQGYIPRGVLLRALVKVVKKQREEDNALEVNEKDPYLVDMSRGKAARDEEESGEVRFILLNHDLDENGPMEHQIWLLQLQNLYTVQLPKMPKEYVTRLVFDDRHRSLCLVKKGKGVIGGICFRPFKEQGFTEIVFCAVMANEQVKGYGTHLMNHVKQIMVDRFDIYHLLTFADEFAIGYFTKQGYSKNLAVSKSVYDGFIKEYVGATLMGCELLAGVRYTSFAKHFRMMRDLHVVLSEMQYQDKQEGREEDDEDEDEEKEEDDESAESGQSAKSSSKSAETATTSSGDVKKKKGSAKKKSRVQRQQSSSTPSTPAISTKLTKQSDQPSRRFEPKIKRILGILMKDSNAWPFMEPVNPNEVPEYYDYIEIPVDFSMMKQRLKKGYYKHEHLFIADLCRLFANCYLFNGVETIYYMAGYKLNRLAYREVKSSFPNTKLLPVPPEWQPTYKSDK